MVALIKDKAITPREDQTPKRNGRLRTAQPGPRLRRARPPFQAVPGAAGAFPKEDEGPEPEEASNGKEIFEADVEEVLTAVADAEAEDRGREPRSRKHSSYDGETAFRLYLREIGDVKLLTRQQEVELAARIKRGNKKAREQMIKANLRLVVKIARDYEDLGLPLLDLISEGNIGLMKAVERFDPAKGGKLSTYSSWWIKQAIKRALSNQSKTIRLPVHMVDKIARLRRTALRLQEELGREPADEELGAELGFTPQRVALMRMAAIRPASLDAPIQDEDSNNFGDVVPDESAGTPYELLEAKTVTGMLRDMVKTLDPREVTILRARFGLDGGREQTLDEIGHKMGLTRERIRQVQNLALTKLRKRIENLEARKT